MTNPGDETEDFAAMLDEYGSDSLKLQPGDKVRGEVIHITRDSVFCQLSAAQEAFISREELTNADGQLEVAVGDTIEAFVHNLQAGIELRRRLGSDVIDILLLERARDEQLPVEGTVTGVNKGGLEVTIGGARGFCPISQVDIDFVEDAQQFVGKTLDFLVKEIKERGRNVVLNRRALLQEKRREQAQELMADLEVGQRRQVTVTRLASFGAFADLGGIDGLIPISQLSYGTVAKTEDVVHVGQQVEVEVMRIEEDPKRPGQTRIALSLKATLPDPFTTRADELHEGTTLEGQVARVESYGAFVELFEGVQGLIHISELDDGHVRHPSDVVNVGDTVTVRVLKLDPETRRIGLSLREARASTNERGELAVGAPVEGTVERIERFGLFVKLAQGGQALLPAAETGTEPNTDLARAFPIDTKLALTVIAIDEKGRVKVSKKAREQADERSQVEAYNVSQGSKGLGTLGDLLKTKLKK